jgi:predicted ATPase
LALYDEERHAHHRTLYLGHDPAVCGRAIGATVKFALGYPAQADRLDGEAIALARNLRHPPSIVIALWLHCLGRAVVNDCAAVIETVPELLKVSDEHGLLQGQAIGLILLGWALSRSGAADEGIGRLTQGLGILSKMGSRHGATVNLCLMGDGLLVAGRYAEGLEQVERALAAAAEIGEDIYVSPAHALRAELLLHTQGRDSEAAEASLNEALAVARQQGKGAELNAATSLARLWLDRGRRDAARELLAPIYAWFTEGFDTPTLVKAKAVLDAAV